MEKLQSFTKHCTKNYRRAGYDISDSSGWVVGDVVRCFDDPYNLQETVKDVKDKLKRLKKNHNFDNKALNKFIRHQYRDIGYHINKVQMDIDASLDLHHGNFMFRKNGTDLVITDPFIGRH